jgi:hypothetical protein
LLRSVSSDSRKSHELPQKDGCDHWPDFFARGLCLERTMSATQWRLVICYLLHEKSLTARRISAKRMTNKSRVTKKSFAVVSRDNTQPENF